MSFTFNGIGTSFHGVRWQPDGTYITTKWLVFFYVPIIPVESVKVVEAGPVSGHSMMRIQPLKTVKAPLDIMMVIKTYAWIAGFIAFVPIANWLAEKL